jgi:arabinose-5-phosphate isomerase
MSSISALTTEAALALARRVIQIEAQAVRDLSVGLDNSFAHAVNLILSSSGRVIVSGIGKSGHIARKIASTLASTGTPAYFVHPAEASHGDLGMIAADDVLIALSNSGESPELLAIVPLAKRQGAKLVAITGNSASSLARDADAHLNAAVAEEACPLGLAPTASTTAALVLGDALAVALLEARGFGAEDFARSHPGGALGRRLLTRVSDVMRSGDQIPRVDESVSLTDAVLEISRKGLGMTAVMRGNRVVGIFTDGDLRRALEKTGDLRSVGVAQVMSRQPHSVQPTQLAVEAAQLMEEHRVSQLLVIDQSGALVGALNTHDLMRAKVI